MKTLSKYHFYNDDILLQTIKDYNNRKIKDSIFLILRRFSFEKLLRDVEKKSSSENQKKRESKLSAFFLFLRIREISPSCKKLLRVLKQQ